VYLCLDFNRDPAVAALAHPLFRGEYPEEHYRPDISHVGFFGEYFNVGGQDAYQLGQALLRGDQGSDGHFPDNWLGLANHRGPIIAFGDATARARRMNGPNEWQIVNDLLSNGTIDEDTGEPRYRTMLPEKGNPLVVFGVRSVNAKLRSASGVRSLWIDPRLMQLIADFFFCVWDRTGTDIQKYGDRGGGLRWQRGHISDAVRYMIHMLFPLGMEVDPLADVPKILRRKPRDIPSYL
jgi:hypothetical protein